MGLFTGESHIYVVAESRQMIERLREYRGSSDASEHAGLDAALAMLEQQASRSDDEILAQWVRDRLNLGDEPITDKVSCVRTLRREFRGMGLLQAVQLADVLIADSQH
jgi:hypothetical protein